MGGNQGLKGDDDDFYPLSKKISLMILSMTNDNKGGKLRKGSKYDVSKITSVFKSLPFKCDINFLDNFTVDDIKSPTGFLSKYIEELQMDPVDAIFIWVMAHGDVKSAIYAYDGTINFKKDILHRFSCEEKPWLSDIPKCLVVNACRGDQEVWETDHQQPKFFTDSFTNMLILYSTLEGFKCYRDPNSGSLFIQNLCDFILKYSKVSHLADIANKVAVYLNKDVEQRVDQKQKGGFKNYFFTAEALEKHISVGESNMSSTEGTDTSIVTPVNSSLVSYGLSTSSRKSKIQIGNLQFKNDIRYDNNVVLQVRVLYGVKVETGEGKSDCFKWLLVDDSNGETGEIEAVAFDETGLILFNKLKIGRCVQVHEAVVDSRFRQYPGIAQNDLQLTIRNSHAVDVIEEQPSLRKYPVMNLTPLIDVKNKHHREILDLLGVVTFSSGIKETELGSKYRKSIIKTLSEDETEVAITLWGNRAKLVLGTVVFMRSVRVIKPSELEDEFDEYFAVEREIKTDHYSVSQQSVVIEINEFLQVSPEYQNEVKSYLEIKEIEEPKKKKSRKSDN